MTTIFPPWWHFPPPPKPGPMRAKFLGDIMFKKYAITLPAPVPADVVKRTLSYKAGDTPAIEITLDPAATGFSVIVDPAVANVFTETYFDAVGNKAVGDPYTLDTTAPTFEGKFSAAFVEDTDTPPGFVS